MTHLTRYTLKAGVALAIVAALIAPPPASAQALYGSITGTVTDPQGAAIPGATVTATNTGTGLKVECRHGRRRATTRSATCSPASTTSGPRSRASAS